MVLLTFFVAQQLKVLVDWIETSAYRTSSPLLQRQATPIRALRRTGFGKFAVPVPSNARLQHWLASQIAKYNQAEMGTLPFIDASC